MQNIFIGVDTPHRNIKYLKNRKYKKNIFFSMWRIKGKYLRQGFTIYYQDIYGYDEIS